jgi:membrane fusion protein, multidrug efflux system
VIRVQKNALLIPQPAVAELQGSYEVAIVGQDDRVAIRPIKVGEHMGTMWVIQDGLKAGERVVVEGQQALRPGMRVQPKPYRGSVQ